MLIQSKGNSLHLLTPSSPSIPLPPPRQPQAYSPSPWFSFIYHKQCPYVLAPPTQASFLARGSEARLPVVFPAHSLLRHPLAGSQSPRGLRNSMTLSAWPVGHYSRADRRSPSGPMKQQCHPVTHSHSKRWKRGDSIPRATGLQRKQMSPPQIDWPWLEPSLQMCGIVS